MKIKKQIDLQSNHKSTEHTAKSKQTKGNLGSVKANMKTLVMTNFEFIKIHKTFVHIHIYNTNTYTLYTYIFIFDWNSYKDTHLEL